MGRYILIPDLRTQPRVRQAKLGPMEKEVETPNRNLELEPSGCKSGRKQWVVKRKTAKDRFNRSVANVIETCRKKRHDKVKEQYKRLSRMMIGHYAYYGIMGNFEALGRFFFAVTGGWQKWLNRRSSGRHMPWKRFAQLLIHYPLPRPRIVHSVLRPIANP
jgi:RNA-directed DNA polymerase